MAVPPRLASEAGALRDLMAEVGAEHWAWEDHFARKGDEELAARPGGEPSAGDYLAHVADWQANALSVARSQASPEVAELDAATGIATALGIDVDRFNREQFDSHRDWSPGQALERYRQVHGELIAALAALPSSRLLGGSGPYGARMWFARPLLLHPRDHRRELEARP